MANILKGKAVADAIDEKSIFIIKENNLTPTLAIFRVGNNESDIAYEKGIDKKSEKVGVKVVKYTFETSISPDEFYQKLDEANNDDNIHGILVFRPLPKQFDNDELRNAIKTEKDIDGCNDASLGAIFLNQDIGYPPCTAQAVIETLDYYGIEIEGKDVVIIGRSLVIGKPVSMLLLNRNATVTICHKVTKHIHNKSRNADILICATGKKDLVNKQFANPNQTIIDVGIIWDEERQKLVGDVNFDEVQPIVENITPVPGGIGSITTSILLNHVVDAAYKQYK